MQYELYNRTFRLISSLATRFQLIVYFAIEYLVTVRHSEGPP